MKTPTTKSDKPFSSQLEDWLSGSQAKTFKSLDEVFAEKSFAVIFLLLMSVPAIPVPTGGITHIFEIITMLLALELIIGRRTIWLPKSLLKREVNKATLQKALPFLMKRIRWLERFSRPRLSGFLKNRFVTALIGIIVFGLALTAAVAVPFSGLDTLPALGVVLIALGMILEDIVGAIMGLIVGVAGIATVVLLGKVIVNKIF